MTKQASRAIGFVVWLVLAFCGITEARVMPPWDTAERRIGIEGSPDYVELALGPRAPKGRSGKLFKGSGGLMLPDGTSSLPVTVVQACNPSTGAMRFDMRTPSGGNMTVTARFDSHCDAAAPIQDGTGWIKIKHRRQKAVKTPVTFRVGSGAGGMSLALESGTYWEYYWYYESTRIVQGGSGTDKAIGTFTVTLGSPTSIGGVQMFPVTVTGETTDADSYHYEPRWSYVGIEKGRLVGTTSSEPYTLRTVFDPGLEWLGGGWLMRFPADTRLHSQDGQIANRYATTSALAATRSLSNPECQYYEGYGVLCAGETTTEVQESEYMKPGIGPVGMHLRVSQSSNSGGIYTSFTHVRDVGLVATSLSADDGWLPKRPPWRRRAPMPTARGWPISVVDGDRVLVFAGRGVDGTSGHQVAAIERYDPAADSWSTIGQLASDTAGYTSGALAGGKVWLLRSTDVIDAYDVATGAWTRPVTALPRSLDGPTKSISAVGTDLVVIGTRNGERATYAFAYRPSTNQWVEGPSTPGYLPQTGTCAVGDFVYAFGAYDEGLQQFRDPVWRYGVYTGTGAGWTNLSATLTLARASPQCAAVGNMVFVIGGKVWGAVSDRVDAFDSAAGTIARKSDMISIRSNAAAATVGGKVYVIGGHLDGSTATDLVEEYDPALDQ